MKSIERPKYAKSFAFKFFWGVLVGYVFILVPILLWNEYSSNSQAIIAIEFVLLILLIFILVLGAFMGFGAYLGALCFASRSQLERFGFVPFGFGVAALLIYAGSAYWVQVRFIEAVLMWSLIALAIGFTAPALALPFGLWIGCLKMFAVGPGICKQCGYSLRHLGPDTVECPECGHRFA